MNTKIISQEEKDFQAIRTKVSFLMYENVPEFIKIEMIDKWFRVKGK